MLLLQKTSNRTANPRPGNAPGDSTFTAGTNLSMAAPVAENLRSGGKVTIPSPPPVDTKNILEPALPLLAETLRELKS